MEELEFLEKVLPLLICRGLTHPEHAACLTDVFSMQDLRERYETAKDWEFRCDDMGWVMESPSLRLARFLTPWQFIALTHDKLGPEYD